MPMAFSRRIRQMVLFAVALPSALVVGIRSVAAEESPFDVPVPLSAQIERTDAAVIARLVARPPRRFFTASAEATPFTVEVVEVLKGGELVTRQAAGKKPFQFQLPLTGDHSVGSQFLALGSSAGAELKWGSPKALDAVALDYVRSLQELPPAKSDRLAFFLGNLEHAHPLLAEDAFAELAPTPYSELTAVKDRLPREKLLPWLGDRNISWLRRGLYANMLGICGKPEDVTQLEKLIKNEDGKIQEALSAMIAAYLALKGPAGMPLVEVLFLQNTDAEFHEVASAIVALQFVDAESKAVPRARLLEALRPLLARPMHASFVIGILTRWQDWEAMPQLVELFKSTDEEYALVRVPVVEYLLACPFPEAKAHLEELAKIDPDAVRHATVWRQLQVAPPNLFPAAPPAASSPSAAERR
jgi:hypothetical protein